MPTLKLVHAYPAQGRADCRAGSDTDEVADVAIRGLRSIAELYSEALVPLEVGNRRSELRIFTTHRPALREVLGQAFVDPAGDFEMSFIHVPTSFVERTPRVRAEMLLDAVHGIAVRLGRARGWDTELLGVCRQHVLDRGLEYRWTSPPKTSPDRRLQAVADYRMPPEGYGRVRLRLVERETGTTVATSEEGLAFCSSDGFRRSAKSLRWRGKDRVTLVPYDWVPGDRGGEVSLSRKEDSWASTIEDYMGCLAVPDGDPSLPALRVSVEGQGATAEEQPSEIGFDGGGGLGGVAVELFDETFTHEMRRLVSPAGQEWWSAAEVRTCRIQVHYGDSAAAVRARLTTGVLRVSVECPPQSLVGADPRALAQGVAGEVLAVIRRRTGLGPHPLFTSNE